MAIVAFSRQYQGPRSLVLVRGFVLLREPSDMLRFGYFRPDIRKGLGSMYLLKDPLLGLQKIRI